MPLTAQYHPLKTHLKNRSLILSSKQAYHTQSSKWKMAESYLPTALSGTQMGQLETFMEQKEHLYSTVMQTDPNHIQTAQLGGQEQNEIS